MTGNVLAMAGFTREITADGGPYSLSLLVKPEADFDDRFRAWDIDAQEFIDVNGWLFDIEDAEAMT